MRNLLFVLAVLVIVAAGATFFASLLKHQSHWAYQICTNAYGLCDHRLWIGAIVAGAAFVVLALKATEI